MDPLLCAPDMHELTESSGDYYCPHSTEEETEAQRDELFAHSHPAGKRQSWDSDTCGQAPESHTLGHYTTQLQIKHKPTYNNNIQTAQQTACDVVVDRR